MNGLHRKQDEAPVSSFNSSNENVYLFLRTETVYFSFIYLLEVKLIKHQRWRMSQTEVSGSDESDLNFSFKHRQTEINSATLIC